MLELSKEDINRAGLSAQADADEILEAASFTNNQNRTIFSPYFGPLSCE
jgi:hypothetical protein